MKSYFGGQLGHRMATLRAPISLVLVDSSFGASTLSLCDLKWSSSISKWVAVEDRDGSIHPNPFYGHCGSTSRSFKLLNDPLRPFGATPSG